MKSVQKKTSMLKKMACAAIAKLARNEAVKMANSTCFYWEYQPKLPASVQSLKKNN